MKKIIAFIFCLCMISTAGSAQSLETKTLTIGGSSYEVIVPTLGNLIAIVNMDVTTFKTTMRALQLSSRRTVLRQLICLYELKSRLIP